MCLLAHHNAGNEEASEAQSTIVIEKLFLHRERSAHRLRKV